MKPIQLSPTRIDVIKETMHQLQIVAEECTLWLLMTWPLQRQQREFNLKKQQP